MNFKKWVLCVLTTTETEAYCSFMSTPPELTVSSWKCIFQISPVFSENFHDLLAIVAESRLDLGYHQVVMWKGEMPGCHSNGSVAWRQSGKPAGMRPQQQLLCQALFGVHTPSSCHFVTILQSQAKQVGMLCLYYDKIFCLRPQRM